MISRQISLACGCFAGVAQSARGACELVHICACGFGVIPAKSESDSLARVLRPNHVAARSDHDVPFQSSVETLREFGKAEILDDAETLVAQHLRQSERIEQAEPWLAQ
jgi:hypothetical protein